jgi:hypothetical protein
VHYSDVSGSLALGDTDTALDKLSGLTEAKYFYGNSRLELERNSVYDPIRNEPAFIALLDAYRENAEEQRKILQAMIQDTSG